MYIKIDNKSGNLDELVERQTMLIEQFERAGGLTYKSRTRSALLGLGFSENDFTMPVGNVKVVCRLVKEEHITLRQQQLCKAEL